MNKNYKRNIYVPEDIYQRLNKIKTVTHKPFWAIIEDFMNYYQTKED